MENVNWTEVYRHRPLMTMDEAAGFVSPNWRADLAHRTLDQWWEPVRYQHRIGEVDVPVLHVSGWYDDEEIGTPANFAAMVAAGRDRQRLLMGPWGHAVNTTRTLGEVDFGPNALIDLDAAVVAFLDEHVKGIKPGQAAAPVRIFVMGAGEWRDEPSWPPPQVAETTLYLSSGGAANSLYGDGRLSASAAGRRPAARLLGARPGPAGPVHHQREQRPDRRPRRLPRRGDPGRRAGLQQRPADRAGRGHRPGAADRARRHLGADTDVTAKLVDVHPNGFAQRLCDGLLRLRYRSGFGREELLTPGEVYEVSIAMWDTCLRLEPGHRLRLEVASSAFPKIDVNLGTGGDMVTETDGVIAHNELWHTAARPSRLLLHIRPVRRPPASGAAPASAAAGGIRNLGSGERSTQRKPVTPPITAIHSVGRRPISVPSTPPARAPSGLVP